MATHIIQLVSSSDSDDFNYGLRFISRFAYEVKDQDKPVRISVWDNIDHPNHRNGESIRYNKYGPVDGGNGAYLDPANRATDDPVSALIETDHFHSCTSSYGPLCNGDTLVFIYPDQRAEVRIMQMLEKARGHARLAVVS